MKQNLGQSPLGTTVTGRAAPESAAAADQLSRLLETKDGSHWLIQQLDCINQCPHLSWPSCSSPNLFLPLTPPKI